MKLEWMVRLRYQIHISIEQTKQKLDKSKNETKTMEKDTNCETYHWKKKYGKNQNKTEDRLHWECSKKKINYDIVQTGMRRNKIDETIDNNKTKNGFPTERIIQNVVWVLYWNIEIQLKVKFFVLFS